MRVARRGLPWLPLLVAMVLGAAGLWLEAVDPRGGESTDPIMVPLLLAYGVAGGLIASRERRNAVGWLLSALCVSMVSSFAVGRYAIAGFDGAVAVPFPEIGAAMAWTWILALSCPVLLAFLVPNGRPLSRGWSRVLAVVAVTLLLVVLAFALGDPGGGSGRSGQDFANPIFVPILEPIYQFVEAAFVIYVVLFGAGAVALAVRYRRSRGVERQQLKWILFGMVAMLAGITTSNVLPGSPVSDAAWALGMLLLPLALAIAIGRHRLYDIDLVIKRTVTYGALSLFLVGIEVGGILVLQELLSGITGAQNYAVAATTLAVAVLFQPARSRIRGWVDRRFYRSRYDATRMVSAFGGSLRHRVEMPRVRDDLIRVVGQAVQPTTITIWLRDDLS